MKVDSRAAVPDELTGVQTVQRGQEAVAMRGAVYNSAIPNVILNSVNRVFRHAPRLRLRASLFIVLR